LSGLNLNGLITSGDDLPRVLPRTGGVFVQTGSELGIGVGQPTFNTVQVTDDHVGDVQAHWNGRPVHSLTGVTTTFIEAERARFDQVMFKLTSPRTGPAQAAVGTELTTLSRTRTSGIAMQSGSVLTVVVDRPSANVVEIVNEGAGNVQVEWNGGMVHSYQGVSTIFVDAINARKDDIILTDSSS
jgi:hypothetical protein